ncbi:hypothetical protein LTR35_016362, partial [Friedmanniomyces endolithicus]
MRLAHFSVKEYLVSDRLQERYQIHLHQISSAVCIASVSLTYLLNIGGSIDRAKLKTKFPLAHYSARYWTGFAALAETSDESVPELAIRLFSDRRACAGWLSLYDPEVSWREELRDSRELPQPLYYTALCGLERSTSALIDKSVDVKAQGGRYGNALQAACTEGRKKIAEMLLRNGADVNAQGGEYGNALQAACARRHEKVVEVLLINGADVDAQGGVYGNALQAACARGYEKIAEMLLSNGADVHAQGGVYGNALQAACAERHKKVAEMLLSRGADVNARRAHLGSVLNVACHTGDESIAELLLDNGADINAQSEGEFSNAVSIANDRGHEHIVEMLLAR